jgi:hypothetical protein
MAVAVAVPGRRGAGEGLVVVVIRARLAELQMGMGLVGFAGFGCLGVARRRFYRALLRLKLRVVIGRSRLGLC